VEGLYRENRFCRGTLTVRDRTLGPLCLDLPTLAVVNTSDEVAPLASIEPLLEAVPTRDVAVIKYAGETGSCCSTLAFLSAAKPTPAFGRTSWPGSQRIARHQSETDSACRKRESTARSAVLP
jgi:hypothetical protein